MQYELLKHRGLQPNENMPSMVLLYLFSSLQKDLQEKAEKKGK